MAPTEKSLVNQDAPATATPLPEKLAASGSQRPHADTVASEAMKLLAEYCAKYKDRLIPVENNNGAYVQDFFSFDPPSFDGGSDDIEVACDWMWDVERIFDLFNFPDQIKVFCATSKLIKHAHNWWMSLKPAQMAEDATHFSWQEFKDMFLDRYVTDAAKFKKELEFLRLEQGNMTVFDYEDKFCRLSLFARRHVNTKEMMAERFVMGLRKEMRGLVAAHRCKDFASAAWTARTLEESVLVRTQPEHVAHQTAGQKRKHRQIYRGQ